MHMHCIHTIHACKAQTLRYIYYTILHHMYVYIYMCTYLYNKWVPHSCACSDIGLENVTELLDCLEISKHSNILRE